MAERLDDVDRRILHHLQRNARISAADIARDLDVASSTVRNRVAKLEAAGVLRGYHADVDYRQAGGRLTYLYVCEAPVTEREAIARRVLAVSGVVEVTELMSGRGNLLVEAVGEDTGDLNRIARDLEDHGVEILDEHLVQGTHRTPFAPFGPGIRWRPGTLQDVISLVGGAEVLTLTVDEGAALDGATLEEANARGLLARDVLVVAVERGDGTAVPRGDTALQAGDVVTLFARTGVPDATLAAFARSA